MPLLGVDGRGADGSVDLRVPVVSLRLTTDLLLSFIREGSRFCYLISGNVLRNHRLTTAIPMGRGSLRFNFL